MVEGDIWVSAQAYPTHLVFQHFLIQFSIVLQIAIQIRPKDIDMVISHDVCGIERHVDAEWAVLVAEAVEEVVMDCNNSELVGEDCVDEEPALDALDVVGDCDVDDGVVILELEIEVVGAGAGAEKDEATISFKLPLANVGRATFPFTAQPPDAAGQAGALKLGE